jgi:hypothetical protein
MSKGHSKTAASRKVEVFRPGTFRAMNGQDYSFSEADVSRMAAGYDAEKAPAPVVVGHPTHDAPAFGWATGFAVNDAGTLVAELGALAPEFVSAVEDGRYRKVSMKFFPPDAPNNPTPGSYYPRHIGFLGGAAPAVSGLAPVQFADGDEAQLVEIAFSLEEATQSTASLMRSVRAFFIEKFGPESANQAVPEYHIRWIEEASKEPDPEPGFAGPPETLPAKEPPMSGDDTQHAAREAALAKRERALVHKENVAFTDSLIEGGKLLPAQKTRVVALLDELSSGDGTEIAFSDGGADKTVPRAQLFKDILSAGAQAVAFGAQDLDADPDRASDKAKNIAFASDGMDVDQDDLATHQKARAYQSQNPGTEYLAAVQAVKEA